MWFYVTQHKTLYKRFTTTTLKANNMCGHDGRHVMRRQFQQTLNAMKILLTIVTSIIAAFSDASTTLNTQHIKGFGVKPPTLFRVSYSPQMGSESKTLSSFAHPIGNIVTNYVHI